ncbi:MAG: DUF1385 domain-containing protein [Firmicutes bacterium]|nr:DUF1385 domain-containing protein [Bacillota bacterium]
MDLSRIFMKNACPTKVGGQAILEGLMMRGSRALAVAIRQPDGDIHLTVEPLKAPGGWKKIPVVRGVGSFISSLVTGTSVLMYGADVLERLEAAEGKGSDGDAADSKAASEKPAEKGIPKSAVFFSVALALVFVVALFILLPTFILGLIKKAGVESVLLLNLIEGVIRICLFIGYIAFCRSVKDVRRTFEYHGAEHKTIHCYENGLELTPENAQIFYTLHPRCGTSFMMFVMIIALLIFSLFGWPDLITRVITRLVFIPVIAGLSYELLQFTGRHDSALVKALSMPGILLQKLTTCEPDLKQLEVAIAAMNAVLPSHEDPEVPVEYWVGVLKADGSLVKNEAETEEYKLSKEKR